jgi:hypothetical protein
MTRAGIALTGILFSCSLLGCAPRHRASPTPEIEEFPALSQIRRIYIANLGNEEGSGLVREKIRLRLAKSTRISVVENPAQADAILTGVAGVDRRYQGSGGDLQTRYTGFGVLRLVDVKTSETIWTFEYKRGRVGPNTSISSRVADQTVDKLLRDTTVADSKK